MRCRNEQDCPRLDQRGHEVGCRRPGIFRQPLRDCSFVDRVVDEKRTRLVTERSTEDDTSLIGEIVHECRVLVSQILLAHRT